MQSLPISPRKYCGLSARWSTGKKTARGKNYQQPISWSILHLYFPVPKDKVLSLTFDPDDIKVNESALERWLNWVKSFYFHGKIS